MNFEISIVITFVVHEEELVIGFPQVTAFTIQ